MPKVEDLTDRIFEKLKVIERTNNDKNGKACWVCQCECGNIVIVRGSDLKRKHTTSCGCRQKSIVSNIGLNNKKYNTYDLSGEYGIGYTSKGEEFYFDLEDYEKIKDYCWCFSDGYLIAPNKNNPSKNLLFHRFVMNCTDDDVAVDHIEHKTFDNRKQKLRICTDSQNNMNHIKRKDNTSGVTGVCFDKRINWYSQIKVKGQKRITLGYFNDFDDAVKARKNAEEKYFGEYSYDNSIKTGGNLKYGISQSSKC